MRRRTATLSQLTLLGLFGALGISASVGLFWMLGTLGTRTTAAAEVPRSGLSIVLLASAEQNLAVDAVEAASDRNGHRVRIERVDPVDPLFAFINAADSRPDVVLSIGPQFLTELDAVSAANLAQPFLILGAQLPEPTANVTAVTWDGADTRFYAGEPSPVDPELMIDALGTGLAKIRAGESGVVELLN